MQIAELQQRPQSSYIKAERKKCQHIFFSSGLYLFSRLCFFHTEFHITYIHLVKFLFHSLVYLKEPKN